jgi:uncharacterized protein (TIGR03083 family)
VTIDYTGQLRTNGELMATAVARDLDAHVPSCPEWNVAKLTIHTGQHHRWVANAVRGDGKVPDDPPKPGLRGDELVEWFRQGWADLADLLDASDDETPAWSWSGDNRIGFWRRRTSLETLIHRWDAENATGEITALDPELAADTVDEMLTVMAPDGDWKYKGPDARVRIAASDFDAAWTIALADDETPEVTRGSDGDVDVTVEAAAQDLSLFLWGRKGSDAVNVTGDEALKGSVVAWLEE